MMRSLGDDRGLLALTTVGRVVVPLAIVGVLGYDGFAVLSTHVSAENKAQDAAYAASQAWHTSPNITTTYQAAVTYMTATGTGDTVLKRGFSVDSDGTVHLLVRAKARTLVFTHVGPLKKWTVTTQHGDANSVN